MTADKDALLRDVLETLQSIGTPQHYGYRRIVALIDRITAALAEKDTSATKDVTLVYRTSAAETELALRNKLIELGWTPPLPKGDE